MADVTTMKISTATRDRLRALGDAGESLEDVVVRALDAYESQQFWAAVGTSAPQPVGALVAFVLVEEITALLPVSFAFAAGAMLGLIVIELAPQAFRRSTLRGATAGTLLGAAVMLALSAVLGV